MAPGVIVMMVYISDLQTIKFSLLNTFSKNYY
jgi:hypothetical protein